MQRTFQKLAGVCKACFRKHNTQQRSMFQELETSSLQTLSLLISVFQQPLRDQTQSLLCHRLIPPALTELGR